MTRAGLAVGLGAVLLVGLIAAIFPQVTWLTPNQTEAKYYVGNHAEGDSFNAQRDAQELLRLGSHGVVLKMGAEGAVVASIENGFTMLPAFHVDTIDTTAAGGNASLMAAAL